MNQTTKTKRRRELRINTEMREFNSLKRPILTTTRFNDFTWNENVRYRETHPVIGCIYPTPEMNNHKLNKDDVIFVLEMNNEQNRIMGVGMIRNKVFIKRYQVYSDDNYNRYAYIGKRRIDRSEMSKEEENIMRTFDILCFTGNRHMKRLQGIKAFPIDMLFKCRKIVDLVDYIRKMFLGRGNVVPPITPSLVKSTH
jgi:hypothetical protein